MIVAPAVLLSAHESQPLVAWGTPANLSQLGGSVLILEDGQPSAKEFGLEVHCDSTRGKGIPITVLP